jgi:hypothetical protein
VRCDLPIVYSRLDINQRLDERATLAILDTGDVGVYPQSLLAYLWIRCLLTAASLVKRAFQALD